MFNQIDVCLTQLYGGIFEVEETFFNRFKWGGAATYIRTGRLRQSPVGSRILRC